MAERTSSPFISPSSILNYFHSKMFPLTSINGAKGLKHGASGNCKPSISAERAWRSRPSESMEESPKQALLEKSIEVVSLLLVHVGLHPIHLLFFLLSVHVISCSG